MASRFLRKSTRRQIRDFDNFQNVYPNLRRSSDQTNLTFNNQSPFDDTRTLKYSSASVLFPAMVPPGYNTHPSSSISLSNLTKIRVSAQEYLPDLPGSKVSPPFDETRLNIPGTEDYIATSSDYRIGFKSATRNKIAIPIDISTNETKTLFKLSQYDTALDPSGPLYGSGSTGFVYYNFQEKRWEDIGLTDQYRGHLGQSTSVSTTDFQQNIGLTGSAYYMQQFVSSLSALRVMSPINRTENGYLGSGIGKIGSPTSFFDAPNASRYHATSSQLLSLSKYIDQPFILEEIEISIPVSSTRKYGPLSGFGPPFNAAQDSGRDIDAINFFIYRQNYSSNKLDAESSKRKLVSFSTVAFYNKDVGFYTDQLTDEALDTYTTFEARYNYGINQFVPNTTTTIEQNITIKTKPKNAVQQARNTNQLEYKYSLSGSRSAFTQCLMGSTWQGSDFVNFSNNENPMFSFEFSSPGTGFLRRDVTRNLGVSPYVKIQDTTKQLLADPRFIYKTAVIPSSDLYGRVNLQPGLSPYILYPEDDLIFGIDALVGIVAPLGTFDLNTPISDTSFLSVTSSLQKILAGDAKITLYGSLIQNGQEKIFNNLNQNLISPAIHELIYDPTEDSDQFLIGERYAYSGSYLDHFFSTGSVLNRNRFVSASLTSQADLVGGRGSFERFVNLSNPNEIYYDCLVLDGRSIDNEDEAFNYIPIADAFSPITSSLGSNYFQTDGNLRPNFPYRTGKVRQLNTSKLIVSNTVYSGKDFKNAFFYTGKNQYSSFPYDIKTFVSTSYPGSNYIAYGMLNTLDQQPKNVFRPDTYGQYRDMLEQSFDTITYSLSGKVGPTTPAVSIQFVSASSESAVDPLLTNSNNLSQYATSSLPYFDGFNRSRSGPFPSSSLGPFKPTTIVFQT